MIRTALIQYITDAITAAQREGALPQYVLPPVTVDHPDVSAHGDYTTNIALIIGKMIGKNPREVAEKIKESLDHPSSRDLRSHYGAGRITESHDGTSPPRGPAPARPAFGPSPRKRGGMDAVDRIEIAGPGFLNIWLKEEWLCSVLTTVLKLKKKFGASNEGKGKTVIVEYSSPNIAKPMGIQHLRSTIIGQALANIYDTLGYRVIRDNHLGDFGTQFGKLIVAYRLWSTKKASALTIDDLLKLYIRFHDEVKKDASLDTQARQETKKLQGKERTNTALWKHFVRVSMREFNRVYKRIGVRFDTVLGESSYEALLPTVLEEAQAKGVAQVSDGATVIFMPEVSKDPFLIQKSDGAYLYSTTDLATIRYREKRWHPDRVIYVVANQQALHFVQLFHAAKLLGYGATEKLVHIKFGMVLGSDGKKLATREGKVIALDDVMNEAVKRASVILHENIKTKKEKERIAEVIGIGALKYNDLSQHRQTDILVDWDKMLSFTGNSAPYLQYVVVRIRGILRKTQKHKNIKTQKHNALTQDERALLRLLYRFPDIIRDAAERNEPHHIATYLFSLASTFHAFYEHDPVLTAEGGTRAFRLQLISSIEQIIVNGLALLGIDVPSKM